MTDGKRVELWAAPVPIVGRLFDHHWLVVYSAGSFNRWEVWHQKTNHATSWGHVHKDLMPPKADVGCGKSRLLRQWVGADAEAIVRRLVNSPTRYPWRDRYRVFPGPNSNTFVQWALGDAHSLNRRGVGASYWRFSGRPA